MAKTAVSYPIDFKIGRQRFSIESHINRIRVANSRERTSSTWQQNSDNAVPIKTRGSRRQSEFEENNTNDIRATKSTRESSDKKDKTKPLKGLDVDEKSLNSSKENTKERLTTSDSNHTRKTRRNNASGKSVESKNSLDTNVEKKRRKSSVSRKSDDAHNQARNVQKNIGNETKKSRKTNPVKTSAEKTDDDEPVKLDLGKRQSISYEKHINRIHRANSSRQSLSSYKNDKLNFSKYLNVSEEGLDSSKGNTKKRLSTSDSNPTRKTRQNNASGKSVESKNSLDTGVKGKRRKSSISQKPDEAHNQDKNVQKSIRSEAKISLKTNPVKTHIKEDTENTRKAASRKPSDKNQSEKKKIEPTSEKARPESAKNEKKKSEPSLEKVRPESAKNKKKINEPNFQKANQVKNLKPKYSKEDIILKWVLGHSDPLSDSSETHRFPVAILKKPVKNSVDKSDDLPDNKESSDLKTEEPVKEKGNLAGSNRRPKVQNSESNSTEMTTEEVPDVQMRVSELGKLLIVMNSEIISDEVAAIVVWVDQIPREFLVPQYHRRLSLARTPESESADKFEYAVTSKENIYVSLVNSLTGDSKTALREKLSDLF